MIRKLRSFGLVLLVLSALGSIAATSASAAGEAFHAEGEPVIGTGTGESPHVFKIGSNEVTCKHAQFSSTTSGSTASSLTMHPEYTECTWLEEPAAIDADGCNLIFSAGTNGNGHLPIQLSCTSGKAVTVTSSACILSFGSQNAEGGARATNFGSGSTRNVTIEATATMTFTKSGPLCFLVPGNTGSYTGSSVAKGYVDSGVSGPIDEDKTTFTEGKQLGVWWE